jgi:DNA-directed RNA polymerase subunit RPC12/RpoP
MSTCGNCGAKLSCSCQKRTLADGKQGCSGCATKVAAKAKPTVAKANDANTVNTNTWGPNRYLNLKKFTK